MWGVADEELGRMMRQLEYVEQRRRSIEVGRLNNRMRQLEALKKGKPCNADRHLIINEKMTECGLKIGSEEEKIYPYQPERNAAPVEWYLFHHRREFEERKGNVKEMRMVW